MDLVRGDRCPRQEPCGRPSTLAAAKVILRRQQSEPVDLEPGPDSTSSVIGGQHLIAAADAEHRGGPPSPVARRRPARAPAARPGRTTVARDPGSTTRSAPATTSGSRGDPDLDSRLGGQRVDIGRRSTPGAAGPRRSAGSPGSMHHGAARRRCRGVLAIQPDVGQPRQDADERDPGPPGQLVQPGLQHVGIAAELVDHEALISARSALIEQAPRCRTARRTRRPGRCRRRR